MKKLKLILPLLGIAFSLTSCLKDTPNFNPEDSNNVTEFANTGSIIDQPTASSAVHYLADLGILDLNDTSHFNVNLSYSGADQAPEDISVNVEVSQAVLDSFNKAQGTSYVLPPTSVVDLSTFPTTSIIKKGQHRAQFQVPVKYSADYDFSEVYAIPLKIATTSHGVISGNYGAAIYTLSIRNILDGSYLYTTSANTSLIPNQSKNVTLVTVGQHTAQITPGLLGNYTNVVQYTIDPTTNKITVTCPSLGVFTPQDTRSYFDPATHNLYVWWKQGNGARTFEETFTYTGVRD